MQLASRCLPLGALPYSNTESTTRMAAKLFEKMPALVPLPLLNTEETILHRTLQNIPGIKIKDKKFVLKVTSNHFKQGLVELDAIFNNPTAENLQKYAINSVFMESFFSLLKKFKSPNACINLLGPFSLSQMIESNTEEEHILIDKSCRKLFIQSIAVKALWAINEIKSISPDTTPVVILEEPLLGQLGNVKRENEDVTVELVVNLFTKLIEKIKEAGAIVAVQCMEKCDWKVPIAAGVDIISFDAYNNPNNLCIIPDQVTEFLERGGRINWAIVPVMTEAVVKALNIDMVTNRLLATLDGLVLAGVPEKLVYNSALVSIQGNVDKLPLIFAEKAIILSSQLAKRIPVKS